MLLPRCRRKEAAQLGRARAHRLCRRRLATCDASGGARVTVAREAREQLARQLREHLGRLALGLGLGLGLGSGLGLGLARQLGEHLTLRHPILLVEPEQRLVRREAQAGERG